jgi:hypothetical protein
VSITKPTLTHLGSNLTLHNNFGSISETSKTLSWDEPGKEQKFSQNMRAGSLLSSMGKLFDSKLFKNTLKEKGLLNAGQFGAWCLCMPQHGTSLYLASWSFDSFNFNCNTKMSMAAVFLDVGKAFDKTWHFGPIYIVKT